jgi:MoxR-like ATPase
MSEGSVDQSAQHSQLCGELASEVAKVLVGQDAMVSRLLIGLLTGGHVLLEGVPGLAKTLTVRVLAQAIDTGFSRIQFTPDMLPADVIGTEVFNPREATYSIKKGPIFSNLILADEINRAPAKVQAALLEAMQERQVTIGDTTIQLEEPFLVLATQNPIELEGTFPLPEAQLDRFLMKIALGYPTREDENRILLRFERVDPLDELESVVDPATIIEMQTQVREIRVEASVRNYIVNVCRATRNHSEIELGASPRATMALYRTCQALAAIRGREYVLPDDVKTMAPFVLTHRLIIAAQTRLRGRQPEDIIRDVVGTVAVPVES